MYPHVAHPAAWCMTYHKEQSANVSGSEASGMQYLSKPRGKGYSLRMPTPSVLVGTENPWTGTPFGIEIKLGLDTRHHAEMVRIRDVRVGRIRQLEADARPVKGNAVWAESSTCLFSKLLRRQCSNAPLAKTVLFTEQLMQDPLVKAFL